MKNLLFALLIVSIFACQDTKNENKKADENNHVFLFFDKTQSVDVNNEFVKNKFVAALTKLINNEIVNEGDKVEVYYIHENTAKSKCLEMVSRVKKENDEGLSQADLDAANTNYDIAIEKERRLMLAQIIDKMMTNNSNSSNRETNITASVPLLANAYASNSNVSAYYFSDMVESVKAGRDFGKMAPISVSQAEEWAKTDADKNKNFSLSGVKITMILPFDPMSSSKTNNPNVGDYWKKYFDILGATQIAEM